MSKSYDAMSIDELYHEINREIDAYDCDEDRLEDATDKWLIRRAARDAILDLQEQLDRENLVLVPNFPTAHQVTVGLELHASYEGPGWQGLAMNLYRAMIDASPLPSPSESKGG